MKLPAHPKCKAPKPAEGTAYCGDTCNCGYKEVKRLHAERAVRAQIEAYERRWGPLPAPVSGDGFVEEL